MQEITLTDADHEQLKAIRKNNPVFSFLEEKATWAFKVGDVVVRYMKHLDGTRTISPISDSNPAPKKYKVVHIDEYGVPYLRIITRDGKTLSNSIVCLANQAHDSFSFGLDPDYATHIILDNVDSYDPMEQAKVHRVLRKEANEHNKKLFTHVTSWAVGEPFISNWKVGDHFWQRFVDGRGVARHYEYEIISTRKFKDYHEMSTAGIRHSIVPLIDGHHANNPIWCVEVRNVAFTGARAQTWTTKDLIGKKLSN